jgi:hypothetical protein
MDVRPEHYKVVEKDLSISVEDHDVVMDLEKVDRAWLHVPAEKVKNREKGTPSSGQTPPARPELPPPQPAEKPVEVNPASVEKPTNPWQACQREYSQLRRDFKGVGLFHNPRTAKEKSLKKAYLGLLAKHSCEGASFLPVFYRTHPRSLPEARRRAKERRERRAALELTLLAHAATANAAKRRLERPSRPGGNPAHKMKGPGEELKCA